MSFMEHQVLGYKSPLYGRRTAQFKILPFDYWDTRKMLSGFSQEEQAILYGITGGIPEYLSHIKLNRTIEENIIDLFFTSSGRLNEEPSNLLKQELRDPSAYYAILTAIADGHSKLNEIATTVGMVSSGCSNLLTSLIELGLVRKEKPVGENTTKKTIYKIEDQMFRFWFRFVGKNTDMITAGYGEQVFLNVVQEQLTDFMGQVYEKICTDWLLRQLGRNKLPFFFSQIGHWWGGNPKTKMQEEIDILALGTEGALFGECKWRNEPVNVTVLEKMIERTCLFSYKKNYMYLFSKTGFTKECIQEARKSEYITLIEFGQMAEE